MRHKVLLSSVVLPLYLALFLVKALHLLAGGRAELTSLVRALLRRDHAIDAMDLAIGLFYHLFH
jgi:hypothetical protein